MGNQVAAGAVAPVQAKMSSRHMLVILTGIMITFGCSALTFSTWGLFQPVVAEALNVPKTEFALYVTVMYLTMTACAPFAGKILQSTDVRIALTVAACFVSGAFLLLSVSNTIWMFYVGGVMLGVGEIFLLWLAVPTLINSWFVKRAGTIIGVCMAFTGVGGAVWAAVFTALRSGGADFHSIYRIWAVVAFVTAVPFTLFCVRNKPSDVGLVAYGAEQVAGKSAEPVRGLSAKLAMRSPVFYALCLFAGIINIAVLIATQFPTYTKQLHNVGFDTLVVGGLMTTIMMVGQAIGKITIGSVADRSARGALYFATIAGAAGVLLCWFGFATPSVLYTGSFIFGFFYATALVLVPVLARQVFGSREYPVIYSRVSTAFNLIAAFASVFWAWLGATKYHFDGVFSVGLVMIALVFVLGLYIIQRIKTVKDAWT